MFATGKNRTILQAYEAMALPSVRYPGPFDAQESRQANPVVAEVPPLTRSTRVL